MRIIIKDEGELGKRAGEILAALGDRRIVSLRGAMGAGKTTLVSALCRELGSMDDVSSPTFSIINEYETEEGEKVYHFDFYRIETPEQAMELGLEDYFESGALCLMEWAENVAEFLPEETVTVDITEQEDGSRAVDIQI